MGRAFGIIVASVLVVMLSGCLQVHRPVVPDDILATADLEWTVTAKDPIGDSDFAPKAIETQYRYDPGSGDPGYPGVLVLVGLRTIQRIDEDTLLDHAEEILREEMESYGVQADTVTKETGSRTIESGASTRWLTMTGTATSDALLFSQAQEIKVLAEAWFDDPSNMHVVAVAIAQTVDSGLFGQEQRDHATWNELVGDEEGSIEGAVHPEGFIDHAVVQN